MTTTTSAYLTVVQNLPRMQAMTADQPDCQNRQRLLRRQHRQGHFDRSVCRKLPASFLCSRRLRIGRPDQFDRVDQTGARGRRHQSEGPRQHVAAVEGFCDRFQFHRRRRFVNLHLHRHQGHAKQLRRADAREQRGPAGRRRTACAMYFNRVAPSVTSSYGILADQNLLEVVETIFGLPTAFSSENIDVQAKAVSKLLPHFRSEKSSQTEGADGALHRRIRHDLRQFVEFVVNPQRVRIVVVVLGFALGRRYHIERHYQREQLEQQQQFAVQQCAAAKSARLLARRLIRRLSSTISAFAPPRRRQSGASVLLFNAATPSRPGLGAVLLARRHATMNRYVPVSDA